MSSLAARHALFDKPHRTRASDGTSLAWGRIGDGDRVPILFANGWSCPDSYWVDILPAMVALGHPAIVMDNRGHGQSGLPREPGLRAQHINVDDVSAARMGRDFLEVLDAAAVPRAVLAGHSLGVQTIFEAYRIAPDRVAGLVPMSGTYENPIATFANLGFLDPLAPIGWRLFSALPLGLAPPLLRAVAHPSIGYRVFRLLRVAGPKARPEHVEPHVRQFSEVHLGVLMKMMAAMQEHSAADLLPDLAVPLLVCAGHQDVFTPFRVQQRMAELAPRGRLVDFPDAGHMVPIEEPTAVIAALTDFLASEVG